MKTKPAFLVGLLLAIFSMLSLRTSYFLMRAGIIPINYRLIVFEDLAKNF